MNHLPIDPDADSRRRAGLPCPNCNRGRDCSQCRNNDCQTHWQYLLKNAGTRVSLQCPICAHLWTVDAIADEVDGHGRQAAGPSSRRFRFGGRAGEVAVSPDYVYVMVDDSVKGHQPFAPHRRDLSRRSPPEEHCRERRRDARLCHGLRRFHVDHQHCRQHGETFVLDRSTAEVVSPDGNYI